MQWIIENKEWLLSGVLVAVPLALIGWFFSSRGNKQTQKSGNNSTNIQVGRDLRIGSGKDDK